MKNQNGLQRGLTTLGLVVFFAFFSAVFAQAQNRDNNDSKGFFGGDKAARFGIKGGVNFSQLNVDPSDVSVNKENWKLGFHGGLFLKAPLGEFFAIQPELLYTNAGSKVEYGAGQNTQSGLQLSDAIRYNFNYLQLPLLASITLGPISLQAGPYASYLLGVNVKNFNVDNPTNQQTIAKPNRDNYNKLDYGLAGGLAIDIKGFQLGARYNYGLREVGGSGITRTLTNNAKNSVGQVFLAVGF